MVLQLLSSLRPSRRAAGSGFSGLPAFDDGDCDRRRDYRLLAGGLALVLSRCPPRGVERHFPNSAKAFRSLRIQLAIPFAPVRLPAQTLNELAHEIALCADAATRAAARRCLQRAVAH